jgi:hypothetical protein
MGEIKLDKDAANAPSASPSAAAKPMLYRPMQHVTKAMACLQEAGLRLDKTTTADNPLVTIMSELAPLGESDVVAIARTMAHMENFNDMIRKRAAELDTRVGSRFEDIAESFSSIREDSANMVKRAEKGRLSLMDRASVAVMNMRRGSIPERFQKIADTATEVFKDTENQLRLERGMTDAYKLMRMGVAEARMLAKGLRDKARDQLSEARDLMARAQAVVDKAVEDKDFDAQPEAEMHRDRALNVVQACDHRFQTAEDIYNGLTVAYAAGEAVIARLTQTTDAKERVMRQAVSFFSTNKSTLTVLGVSLTGLAGLNEITRSMRAMKAGTKESIEALANIGTQIQEAALREGYGATIEVEAVRTLMDSVIAYQERSHEIIKEMRTVAAANAEALSAEVEKGKSKLIELVNRQAAEPVPGSESTPALEYQPETDTTLGVFEPGSRQKAEQTLAQALRE